MTQNERLNTSNGRCSIWHNILLDQQTGSSQHHQHK